MKVGRRISVTALNTNINADLNLGCGYNLLASAIVCPATCGSGLFMYHNTTLDQYTMLSGATLAAGAAARIGIYGRSYAGTPGDVIISVPNAAGNNDLTVASFEGNTDTPYLNMNSRRIAGIAAPTTAGDALIHQAWAAWTPTLVWSGATPASLTITCRWTQIGKTVFFYVYINSSDSNACTNCTITLPSTPANTGAHHVVDCRQTYGVAGVTYATISFFIIQDGSETRLQTNQFNACTDGQTVQLMMSGNYEVA